MLRTVLAPVMLLGAGIAPMASPVPAHAGQPDSDVTVRDRSVLDAYRSMPLGFVRDSGHADRDIRYSTQGAGFGFSFLTDRVVLAFERDGRSTSVQLVPVSPDPHATLVARGRVPGTINRFVGSEHRVALAPARRVVYRGLWPGIDLVFAGRDARLKYEFHVAPGADPGRIRLAYEGVDDLTLVSGALVAGTALGDLRDSRPQTFQRVGTERTQVASRYVLDAATRSYGFAVGDYDRDRPLVIDPGLDYSTFLGGSTNDIGVDVDVDDDGNAYVTGATRSAIDFPATSGSADATYNSDPAAVDVRDVFVTKFDRRGSEVVYSTFIGGSGAESGQGIAVDSEGSAYVSGGTGSSDFPTTPGAFDESHNGFEDAFVVKLAPDGSSIEYATVLGGGTVEGEFAPGIAVDGRGHAFVTGGTGSPEFPTTEDAFDTSHDGLLDVFVAELNPAGSGLEYSTLLGGSNNDVGFRIALRDGDAYVTGDTKSPNFPTTRGTFDDSFNGGDDAFVAKVSPDEEPALAYSTFLGGAAPDYGRGIAVDRRGSAYVTGGTASANFPTTRGAFDRRHNLEEDAFVTRLDPEGARLRSSTFIGGSSRDRGNAVAIGRGGIAVIGGDTDSANFPTTRDAFQRRYGGRQDAFVTWLSADASALAGSTFLGGAAVDFGRGLALGRDGDAYLTGRTASEDFPVTRGAFDADANGQLDGFVAKFDRLGRSTA
jgi:hypothetical protein